MKYARLLLPLILVLGLVSCSLSASTPEIRAVEIPPQFQEVMSNLETAIPVLLPTEIPESFLSQRSEGGVPIDYYASASEATNADFYEISIDASPDCGGAGYCYIGLLEGRRLVEDLPLDNEFDYLSDPTYTPVRQSDEPMTSVELAGGIEGLFVPWVCGASCDTAKVVFDLNGVRYKVGLRMATMTQVTELANNMLQNSQVTGS